MTKINLVRRLKCEKAMSLDYSRIPDTTIATLTAWITHARPMGAFCQALVANDLLAVCRYADERNAGALFDIVGWLYNNAPSGAWGSPGALKSWPKRFRDSQRCETASFAQDTSEELQAGKEQHDEDQ